VALELKSETFAGHVGETFEVTPQVAERFELVLTSCEETPYGSAEDWQDAIQRVPFSLFFHDADGSRFLPQQIVSFRHPELGEFELFIVPLGPDERGMRYEAVIN
jgi:hypothetical protein